MNNFKRVLSIAATWLILSGIFVAPVTAQADVDAEDFKAAYSLQRHAEGGWFAEIYTAPFTSENRATAGSICFLLDKDDVSHFHQLDCDEIWYYHAGCGMKIFILHDGKVEEHLLGLDTRRNEQPTVVVPAGAIFAAENIDKDGFTLVSCTTTPRFTYDGFRLVPRSELERSYPHLPENILRLAYEKIPTP
ncbi:MAG: cupin domain-containing protein [Quinella sp. 1Q7]|nr:cupin domain-containing protein [Quinella sp. 1Q7]